MHHELVQVLGKGKGEESGNGEGCGLEMVGLSGGREGGEPNVAETIPRAVTQVLKLQRGEGEVIRGE